MMNEVKTRYMSSDRQANQANMGFVPTSKDIVEMELNLIDFSELANNEFSINLCDLSGGTGDQLHWTNEYLLNQGIKCSAYYNEISEIRYSECVSKYPYMNHLNSDALNIKVGHKENRTLNKKMFSIIRNNPPYMYIERRGSNVRAEMVFFEKNTLHDINGGIHIMEIPMHQLRGIRGFLSMICYRYEIFIAKFPKEVYEKYKQVAIICKKKHTPFQDKEVVSDLTYCIDNDLIPYLNEVNQKVIKVSRSDFKKAKDINIFRENKVTEDTLSNGLSEVLDNLIIADKKANKQIVNNDKLKPIIELQPGHISQLLASGRYDGLMGDLLIRGGANKVVEVQETEEGSKTVTVETEVLKPFIEITNKNGDILYKDF